MDISVASRNSGVRSGLSSASLQLRLPGGSGPAFVWYLPIRVIVIGVLRPQVKLNGRYARIFAESVACGRS